MTSTTVSLLIAVALFAPGQLDAPQESTFDSALTAKIETTFLFNDLLSPYDIKTTTEDGVVTLSGRVDEQIQKDLAGDLAAAYEEVARVDNQITVAPETAAPVSKSRKLRRKIKDHSISAAVRTRLRYRKNLRAFDFKASTENGVVTVNGMVDTQFQKDEAEHVAFQTKGVKKVVNRVAVRATDSPLDSDKLQSLQSDSDVTKRVEKSISLNRHLSESQIGVQVKGGICLLSGSVQSESEKRLAESIAKNTTGVSEVRNTLNVQSAAGGNDIFLEILEPLDEPLVREKINTGQPSPPASDDAPLFSEGARID